jgi:hypothetical protein
LPVRWISTGPISKLPPVAAFSIANSSS